MNLIFDTYRKTGSLHHAYLIEGEKESSLAELSKFLEQELDFKTQGNPDFWHGEFDTLGIDEGRILQDRQQKKSLGKKKVFVISTNFITREAQNSLLKMFEEPTADTHFFILIGSGESLLPTLKSRLFFITNSSIETNIDVRKTVEDFFKKTGSERIALFEQIIENKEKEPAIIFLNHLETALREKLKNKQLTTDQIFVFDEILKARSYLHDRSPSIKMILEHLSLIIPLG